MISKNKTKFIQSLSRKKEREELGIFIAEGEKLITELIKADFSIDLLVTSSADLAKKMNHISEVIICDESEMKKISLLKTPSSILAVVKTPLRNALPDPLPDDLIIALDGIQDPGNMGTIIRLASWFGIKNIVCSTNCVECFNPKVVQATMGAIAHVEVTYTELDSFIMRALKEKRTVYGTLLEGQNIYTSDLEKNGIIVLGNEGNGISPAIEKLIINRLSIPSFGPRNKTVESLNVSVAAAIVCSEFRRR
jgi:TrmH family RNA methyltransferase